MHKVIDIYTVSVKLTKDVIPESGLKYITSVLKTNPFDSVDEIRCIEKKRDCLQYLKENYNYFIEFSDVLSQKKKQQYLTIQSLEQYSEYKSHKKLKLLIYVSRCQ